MSTTVRVSTHTRDRVSALAAMTGRRMSQVIDDAVAEYEQHVFWRVFEGGYARIAEDPAAGAEVEAERRGEAASLSDGLD